MDIETRYNLALDYLYSFVDYSLKKADQLAAANFDLARMRALMTALGNPQDCYPTIHVAGTKGKGSTSALCAAALRAAGYRVGLYTSPHLQDFCERIQVDDEPIPHHTLADLLDEIKSAVAQIPALTTFELTTALGFLYFFRQKVDVAVIEVGLGGRLDATNVITPQVSVLTTISYDHMAVLGDTLAKIAAEKAGIIKPGVPVICSPQPVEALAVFETIAAERRSEMTLVGLDLLYAGGPASQEGQYFDVWVPGMRHSHLFTSLLGRHQVENAVTAYAALQRSGFNLTDNEIRQGFSAVRWPCRFEILSREAPVLIADSAHNQDSFRRLTETVQDYFPGQKVLLILGISEDKHLEAMLTSMKGIISRLLITHANHPRALEPEIVAETALQMGFSCEIISPASAALNRAIELAQVGGQIILSAGSMFVTAEVKTAWQTLQGQH